MRSVALAAIVLLAAPLTMNVPLAVLTDILMFTAWNRRELQHVLHPSGEFS